MRSFFRAVFFRVTHNGLSERGTTRSARLLRSVGDWVVVVNDIFTFLVAQLLVCLFIFFFFPFLFLLSYWSRLQLQVRLRNLNIWSRELHPDIICFGANKHSVVFCVSKVLLVCQEQSRIEQYHCVTISHGNGTRLVRRTHQSVYILHPHMHAKCKH